MNNLQPKPSSAAVSDFWKKKKIVSFLLSIMVCLIHISSFGQYSHIADNMSGVNEVLSKVIRDSFTRYAVPLFFIISGALFFRDYNDKKYLDKIKKRINTLLIPYLFWNVVWLLFDIATSYTFISNYFIGREKFVLSFSSVLDAILHHKCNVVFWFVFDLMFFVLISPIIDKLVHNRYIGIGVTVLLAVLCLFNLGLPVNVFTYPTSIVYYFIGAIIGKHFFDGFCKKTSLLVQIISLIILLITAVVFYFADLIDSNPYFTFLLVPCAWAFWNVADLFVYKLPSFSLFKNSFVIYAMHINVSAVITKLLYLVFPKCGWMALPNFILTLVLTVSVIHLFCHIVNKISPNLYKIITGGRK